MQPSNVPTGSSRRQHLLAMLREQQGLRDSREHISRRPAGVNRVPLSSGQRRLWLLDRLAPENPVYNVPTSFRVFGPLDVQAFRKALDDLIRRHEILRTTFEVQDDEPIQVISDHTAVEPVIVDLRHDQSQASLNERIAAEARCPFNLAQGPLIRATLFHLGHEEHVVLITTHHIVFDGWSAGILLGEFPALYTSGLRGTPPFLPELTLQYGDYALWQQQRLQAGTIDGQIEFWRRHLQNAPTVLDLPTDRSRPQQPGFRGAVLQTFIESPLADHLLDIARLESTTPFVLCLTAFAVLIHRYSAQNDFLIGCPVSNRNRSELEPLIGFFSNTLPLRMQVPPDASFVELLRNAREITTQAFANSEAPFEAITNAVTSSRSSHNPLFQVAFMMQNRPPERMVFGELEVAPFDLDLGTAKCDLTVVANTRRDGLSLSLEYSADLFEASTIRRMAGHFKTLLEGIAAHPEARISELPLMPETEKRQVLTQWSRTSAIPSDPRAFHELFEHQAAANPNAPALMFNGTEVSYADLNRRANGIAKELRHMVGAGRLIAIALPRSPDMIAAILGILKAGAAYLPLSPEHPADRIAFQIEDARPAMLLTDSGRQALPAAAAALARLEISQLSTDDTQEAHPGATSQPSDIAYVIYTSGSTGRPKGVILEQRGLTNLALAQQAMFKLGPGCRVLQFAPLTFDASVWEIAMALASGACLCLGTGAAFVPGELSRVLREQRVTTVTLPPSILRTLKSDDLPELRTIISAGETCPESLAREWSDGRAFFNAYGPTEATVCATALLWNNSLQRVTIGRPIPNVRTYILDSNMQPLPAGVPGELHIGGAGVARGYLNRPTLTRAQFVSDPFERDGSRLYKTGDLARYLPGGDIEFLGRIDEQLKIRGHRIEPAEIEAHLESHPAVRECAVVASRTTSGDARLIAYFVPSGDAPGKDELRSYASRALPQYMIPADFVPRLELPVNSSGKIDRRALSEVPVSTPAARVAPRDSIEADVARIWAEILNVPAVGVTDNFFELGGSSLTAVNVMGRIAARTGCDLPVSMLFHSGTVQQIAEHVRQRTNPGSPGSSLIPVHAHGSRPPLVLIPPAGGSLVAYSQLARLLGADQPVFGAEPGWDNQRPSTVEALAARYVQQLRSERFPHPARLAGWSFGGNVAFEMARQLADAGQSVDLVILLDSHATHEERPPANLDILLEIARVRALAQNLDLQIDRSRLRQLKEEDRLRFVAAQLQQDPDMPVETIAMELFTILQQFRSEIRAARRHVPGRYSGRVALLRASESGGSRDYGWSRFCSDLDILEVPGTHQSLVTQPHVSAVAATVDNLLSSRAAPRS